MSLKLLAQTGGNQKGTVVIHYPFFSNTYGGLQVEATNEQAKPGDSATRYLRTVKGEEILRESFCLFVRGALGAGSACFLIILVRR